jgi:hypothetical protein
MRIADIAASEPDRIGGERKLQIWRWGAAYYFQFWQELVYWRRPAMLYRAAAAKRGNDAGA